MFRLALPFGLGDESAAPYAVVALPRDFFAGAPDAVHLHAVRARRHVYNGPVASGSVVGFANVRTFGVLARVVVLFVLWCRERWALAAGYCGSGRARFAVGACWRRSTLIDHDIVVVVLAIAIARAVNLDFVIRGSRR